MRLAYLVVAAGVWTMACGGDDDGTPPPGADGSEGVIDSGGAPGTDAGGPGSPDAAGGGGIDAGGGGECAADPVPPGAGECPAVCTGGCAGGVCTIDCDNNDCDGDTHDCPPDYACLVICTGVDHCDTGEVNCPALYACAVECSGGNDACGDMDLNCGDASCTMTCDADACDGATVHCGGGACAATCTGEPAPTTECGGACACAGC